MKNILFIHIPKTGGVTINDTLIKSGYTNKFGHQFSSTIKAKHPKHFDSCVKFTTIRNPWSRLVSVYTFLTVGSEIHKPPAHKDFDKLGVKSFDDFIRKLYDINKGNGDVLILNDNVGASVNLYTMLQYNWVYDGEGNQLVDYICNLNTLSDNIVEFNEKFGYEIDILPPQNQTKHKHYTEMYSDETMKMVEELYMKDIETFNFKFNG